MAIQQSKRQQELEKRLQILRRQVYGRGSNRSEVRIDQKTGKSDTLIYRSSDTPILSETPISSDLTYLRQDLLKILIFSSFAIGTQIILFIFLQNHLLNIKFF